MPICKPGLAQIDPGLDRACMRNGEATVEDHGRKQKSVVLNDTGYRPAIGVRLPAELQTRRTSGSVEALRKSAITPKEPIVAEIAGFRPHFTLPSEWR